ncbi:C2 domain-containing protein [Aureococcus anophagefferens]|nr:C2 domain-containing protein [Aureococcus anophagefferens]
MLDLDLDWRGSGVDVDLSAPRRRLDRRAVPLGLDHVSFKATLRVRCVLGDRSPFAALVDVAFARKPEVLDFGLSVISGDITGLPSIPALVSNALEGVIDGLMVWPRRLSFPLDEWWHPWDVPPAVAHGVLRLTVDRARDLPGADLDGKSDPFVVVEVGGADAGGGFEARETLRTATKSKTLNPTWDGERGAILKEGFGGFKRWSHRWLELELELDLTADGFRLAAVPEINQWNGRPQNFKPLELGHIEARGVRYGKPASTDDAEAARGEVRLSPDAAVSILEEKKKQAVVEAASAALGLDGAALRSAGENGDAVDLYSGATVVVEILEARGLAAADDDGLSDPYAVARLGGETFSTRTIKHTLDPQWFESHEFCGGVALGESRGEYADFSADGAADDDDDDGTPKRTACVNFRRRSGDGGGVEPVPEAMTR